MIQLLLSAITPFYNISALFRPEFASAVLCCCANKQSIILNRIWIIPKRPDSAEWCCGRITDGFRGIYGPYLKFNTWRISGFSMATAFNAVIVTTAALVLLCAAQVLCSSISLFSLLEHTWMHLLLSWWFVLGPFSLDHPLCMVSTILWLSYGTKLGTRELIDLSSGCSKEMLDVW